MHLEIISANCAEVQGVPYQRSSYVLSSAPINPLRCLPCLGKWKWGKFSSYEFDNFNKINEHNLKIDNYQLPTMYFFSFHRFLAQLISIDFMENYRLSILLIKHVRG